MTKRVLHIGNLLGPGIIPPDSEHSFVDVRPAYEFVDGGAINWPVPRRLDFTNGEITIDGMEDSWAAADLVWSFAITFTDGRGKVLATFTATKTFPAGPSAAAVAYSDMIDQESPAPDPDFGPSYLQQTLVAKNEAVSAKSDAEDAAAAAQAVPITTDTIVKSLLDNTSSLTAGGVADAVNESIDSNVIYSAANPAYGIIGDGVANDSAAINALIAYVSGRGGGSIIFPNTIYSCDGVQLRTRTNLLGGNQRGTTFKAVAGSSNTEVLGLRPGVVESANVKNINLLGNGNAGQHGLHFLGATAAGGTNGGWWNSELVNFRSSGFDGHAIWLDSLPAGNSVPHQFLIFRNVKGFSTPGWHAFYTTGQVGQIEYIGGQFENQGIATANTEASANIFISAGGYSHNFRGTTIQEALYGAIIEQASPVVFDQCYFENIGRAVLARAATKMVHILGGNYSNAASDGASGGYGARAEAASILIFEGTKINGSVDTLYSADTSSLVSPRGLNQISATTKPMSGSTKQIAVAGDGSVTFLTRQTTAFVNTTVTPVATIATRGVGSEVIQIKAYNGPLTFVNTGNIDLGSIGTGPLVVKINDWVTLVRQDFTGSRVWQVTSVSNTDGIAPTPDSASPMITGRYYPAVSPSNPTTNTPSNEVLRLGRVAIGHACTATSLSLEVTTAGSAGAVIRLGLYSLDYTTGAATLLVDGGTIDATTTGVKSVTISQALTANSNVLIGAVTQAGPTTLPIVRANAGADPYWGSGSSTTTSQNSGGGIAVTASVSGALPGTIAASGYSILGSGSTPRVLLGA